MAIGPYCGQAGASSHLAECLSVYHQQRMEAQGRQFDLHSASPCCSWLQRKAFGLQAEVTS